MKGDTGHNPVASRLGVREGAIGQWTVQAKEGSYGVQIGVAAGGFDPNTQTYNNKDWWGIYVFGGVSIVHYHAGQGKRTGLKVSLPVEVVVTVDSKKGDGNKWSDDVMCC